MDLLTAVMHEMGHVLGLGHEHHSLMDDELAAGVRRNPDRDDLALALAIEQSVGKRRSRAVADAFFAELELV